MFSILINPKILTDRAVFCDEIADFVSWIKSSRPREGSDVVLVPGEPESIHRQERQSSGIPLRDWTFDALRHAAASLGLSGEIVDQVVRRLN